ncbi:hypothetical protein [Luteimonas sp. R10]|uniref:hypothetical protein n=1 Tax=Luteimonas sp. R10 TaxID=3108176 RepID=UPI003086B143|nr:hypothetical protein U3649_15330 [Luteimonas sp. R10]
MSGGTRIRHAEPGDAAGLHALFSARDAYAATLQKAMRVVTRCAMAPMSTST